RAETRDGQQYADQSERKACSEYERKIEYTGFQGMHDGLLDRSDLILLFRSFTRLTFWRDGRACKYVSAS
ncbi:MAG TPA: hypothetical protein VNO24_26030, partial [Blastocatellia bacterium]|nr:hypothetical protein [Blastocatellia bacterium]